MQRTLKKKKKISHGGTEHTRTNLYLLFVMNQRWALYIDIEGFGEKWNGTSMDAFKGINTLMHGIFCIGESHYRNPPDGLFAHQFGDAFLITSDFHEKSLDRALMIGIALLRQLLAHGETAKCTLAEGEISDIQNCYPLRFVNDLIM